MAFMNHGRVRSRDPRIKVFLPSRMRIDAAWTDACIHNVSTHGLLVTSDGAPDPGTYVEIRRGQAVIIGRAVWKKDRFFGVRTQDRIDLNALKGEPTRPGAPAAPNVERRGADRFVSDAAVARAMERNRALSRLFQFVVFALAVGGAAVILATAVHDVLTAPADRITRAMSGQSD